MSPVSLTSISLFLYVVKFMLSAHLFIYISTLFLDTPGSICQIQYHFEEIYNYINITLPSRIFMSGDIQPSLDVLAVGFGFNLYM